mmetsp:Transcript_23446/g.55396  ORF Transcript_23446/g.55396 Transcript_23446/m.55396 type:complete len:217 (-) Transcript_23446:185-835(-)
MQTQNLFRPRRTLKTLRLLHGEAVHRMYPGSVFARDETELPQLQRGPLQGQFVRPCEAPGARRERERGRDLPPRPEVLPRGSRIAGGRPPGNRAVGRGRGARRRRRALRSRLCALSRRRGPGQGRGEGHPSLAAGRDEGTGRGQARPGPSRVRAIELQARPRALDDLREHGVREIDAGHRVRVRARRRHGRAARQGPGGIPRCRGGDEESPASDRG